MSPMHCNFMINTGHATGYDLEYLGETVRQRVLEHSGVSLEWERWLSPAFIRAPGYGTRCSSVLRWGADGRVQFDEWTHIALTPSPSHSPPLAPSFSTAEHRREQLTLLRAS